MDREADVSGILSQTVDVIGGAGVDADPLSLKRRGEVSAEKGQVDVARGG